MALTWITLIAGVFVLIGLPIGVVLFNRRWAQSGWWILATLVALLIVGNLIERSGVS